MSFYVSITTIAHYKPALDVLMASLPPSWTNRYILVYQNEQRNDYRVFADGHIEVTITNNCSDYGNWIGLHMLLSDGVVPPDSSFLCIHDTCQFVSGDRGAELIQQIILDYPSHDIIWLCNTGQCNICILRKEAIDVGYSRYKDIATMTKQETIDYEWHHNDSRSPKSFPVRHVYLPIPVEPRGSRCVYNAENERVVLFYPSISMEKYFFYALERTHPLSP